MGLTRRDFLHVGGAGLLAAACAPARAVLPDADEPVRAFTARDAGDPLLVIAFLRGGADGLHLAPPVGDASYTKVRGNLALSRTLPFSTGFGLHPGFEPLRPLVERQELAVVHAVGSPHSTRSHFEAQDLMEMGTSGSARQRDGWLARALDGVGDDDPFAALAITSQLPLSLRGSGAFAVGDAGSFGVAGASPTARDALVELYASAEDDPVARSGRRALSALAEFERLVGRPTAARRRVASRRARRPGLAQGAQQLVALDQAGLRLRAVFLESEGWDTHVNQGTESGAMANRVSDLAEAMAVLSDSFRGKRELLVVAMTEFGRTVRPNGSRGSDHGHGSVMLLAGRRVRGGLYGDWRGLGESALFEGRDLPVTTDWRDPLHEVLGAHLGAPPPADTFPGHAPRPLGLLR